ncbi:F-box/WD repeat-containing protein 7 [Frankliniella fusca]|uniref:F-box/WD repeat-containing protein 7 n=1 Tax=Frankliniella fusca TaxID=407009 RepID=A0AAE1HFN8_9NEOP|nr:F-box/WD repeat-containing protein 7 [Frankliniella fusca]
MVEGTEFSLPSEILAGIFQFLPASDIISCTMVCLKWREEINRNKLWRSLCLQDKWVEEWDEPYEVKSVNVEGSRLSPPCPWYATYIRCAHLYDKWKSGSYVIQKMDESVIERHGTSWITSVDVNWIHIALGDVSGCVSIWKLKQEKPEFLQSFSCSFQNVAVNEIFLGDTPTSIAVMQVGLLQVFHKSDRGEYSLCLYKAMIEVPGLPPMPPISNVNEVFPWLLENWYLQECELKSVRELSSVIAFWGTLKSVTTLSLQPGAQLQTLNVPYTSYKVCGVALRPDDSDIIYVAIKQDLVGNVILVYSLCKNTCLEQLNDTSTIVKIYANFNIFVSVNEQGTVTVWDCLKEGKHHVLQPFQITSPNISLHLDRDSILYQTDNKVVSMECKANQAIRQINTLETEKSSNFLSTAIGNVCIFQNGEDIEIQDKAWKYCIKGVLEKDMTYDVWCCDQYIIFKDFCRPPITIWF